MVLFGTFLLTVSVVYFVLPYSILSGGVAGIAVALEPFFHFDRTVFANWAVIILLFVGWIFLGNDFAKKTVLSSVVYPIFTTILSRYPIEMEIDPILASIYAGLLAGLGLGIVMRTGASTGGMDIPPLVLHKITGLKIATLVVIVDALTVALGLATYGMSQVLLGLVSVYVSGRAIDKVLSTGSGSTAKSVQIISDKYEEMRVRIDEMLARGATIVNVQGGFTKENKVMLLCVVSQEQYSHLLEIIRKVDDKAFVITTDATDMHGEGFTYHSPNI